MDDDSSTSRINFDETPSTITDYFDKNWDELQTSILTKSMREYLLGRHEFKGENARQKENQKRMRIRERVKQGLIDFSLINRMEDRDISLIFSDLNTEDTLFLSLVDLVSFIHQGIKNSSIEFEEVIEEAILISERKSSSRPMQTIADVNVNIDTSYRTQTDDEAILKTLLNGESIPREKFAELVISQRELFSPEVLNHVEVTDDGIRFDRDALEDIIEDFDSRELVENSTNEG